MGRQDFDVRLSVLEDKIEWVLNKFSLTNARTGEQKTFKQAYYEEQNATFAAIAADAARRRQDLERPEPQNHEAGADADDGGGEKESFEEFRARLRAENADILSDPSGLLKS